MEIEDGQKSMGPGITIYLWHPRLPCNVGHISMQIGETYYSFWPKSIQMRFFKPGENHSSYEQDIEAEGKIADKTLKIPDSMLSTSDIKHWFEKYLHSHRYNLVSCNCASSVYDCLVKCGIL